MVGLPTGWIGLGCFGLATSAIYGPIVTTLSMLLGALGAVRIAAREPTPRFTARSPWPRRITLLFPALVLPGLVVLDVVEERIGFVEPWHPLGMFVADCLLLTCALSGTAMVVLLLRMAIRAGEDGLALMVRTVMIVLVVGTSSYVMLFVIDLVPDVVRFSAGSTDARLRVVEMLLALLSRMALVGGTVLTLGLVFWFWLMFPDFGERAIARCSTDVATTGMTNADHGPH